MDSKMLQANLDEIAQNLLNELNKGHSENYLSYLKFASQFHSYSFRNLMLIKSQMPHASRVASFNKWSELGGFVKKGEKALKVLAPLLVKDQKSENAEDKRLVGYKLVSVFDISQVENVELMKAPIYADSDAHLDLYLMLKGQVEAQGIKVVEVDRGDGWFGSFNGSEIKIAGQLKNHDKALTLIHEMAHWKLKHMDEQKHLSRAEMECQAESTCFIVAEALGMKAEVSKDYLLSYGTDAKMFLKNLDQIFKCSQIILDMLSVAENVSVESNTTPAVA